MYGMCGAVRRAVRQNAWLSATGIGMAGSIKGGFMQAIMCGTFLSLSAHTESTVGCKKSLKPRSHTWVHWAALPGRNRSISSESQNWNSRSPSCNPPSLRGNRALRCLNGGRAPRTVANPAGMAGTRTSDTVTAELAHTPGDTTVNAGTRRRWLFKTAKTGTASAAQAMCIPQAGRFADQKFPPNGENPYGPIRKTCRGCAEIIKLIIFGRFSLIILKHIYDTTLPPPDPCPELIILPKKIIKINNFLATKLLIFINFDVQNY